MYCFHTAYINKSDINMMIKKNKYIELNHINVTILINLNQHKYQYEYDNTCFILVF